MYDRLDGTSSHQPREAVAAIAQAIKNTPVLKCIVLACERMATASQGVAD
jgi:hypothetical protein